MQFEKSSQTNSTPVFPLTKRQRSSNRKEGCKAFGLSGANDPVIKKVQMNGGGLCRRVSNAKRLFLRLVSSRKNSSPPPLLWSFPFGKERSNVYQGPQLSLMDKECPT